MRQRDTRPERSEEKGLERPKAAFLMSSARRGARGSRGRSKENPGHEQTIVLVATASLLVQELFLLRFFNCPCICALKHA